jgi:hypothetical protein
MTTDELLTQLRLELDDVAEPQLWADAELLGYLDDAQKMFCRLTGGLADASSSITRTNVVIGAKFSTISPKILKIRHAELVSNSRELTILNFEDRENWGSGRDDYGNIFTGLVSTAWASDNLPGPVRAIVVGMERNKIRLIQVPDATDVVQMIVYRLPLGNLTDNCDPEIDEQHHRHLLYWAKYLAYGKQDAETIDKTKSADFQGKFYAYCDQAKAERERREHKYRTVQYGGIC